MTPTLICTIDRGHGGRGEVTDRLHDSHRTPGRKTLRGAFSLRTLTGRILFDLGKSPTMPDLAFAFSQAADVLLAGTEGEGAREALRLRFVGVPEWVP